MEIEDNESIIKDIGEMLAEVLKHEGVYVEYDTGILTIGNQRGVRLVSLVRKAKLVQPNLTSLKAKFEAYKNI